MKYPLVVSFLFVFAISASAVDIIAITEAGQRVILHPDGTWVYETTNSPDPLQILSHGIMDDVMGQCVFARVRNNTKVDYTMVKITVDFYDANNAMVGTQDDVIFSLKAGTFQSIKIYTQGIRFKRYEVYVSYTY
jgi:hypothetical protein